LLTVLEVMQATLCNKYQIQRIVLLQCASGSMFYLPRETTIYHKYSSIEILICIGKL